MKKKGFGFFFVGCNHQTGREIFTVFSSSSSFKRKNERRKCFWNLLPKMSKLQVTTVSARYSYLVLVLDQFFYLYSNDKKYKHMFRDMERFQSC